VCTCAGFPTPTPNFLQLARGVARIIEGICPLLGVAPGHLMSVLRLKVPLAVTLEEK